MTVLARRGPDGATVGEIAGEAGVSPGTFYNHFPSLMDLVETVTHELQSGVEIGSSTLEAVEHDPAARVVIGTFQLLALAEDQPNAAAAFVTLLAAVPSFRTRIRRVVQGAIEAGATSGRFDVPANLSPVDAVLGCAVQWMRSILTGEDGGGSKADRGRLVLRLLGVAEADIEDVISSTLLALAD